MRQRLTGVAAIVCGLMGMIGNGAEGQVTPNAQMMRYPDVSKTSIVFAYANDLWIVDKNGGEARPLASPPGPEVFPRFSPDGTKIAFNGNYDGNRDLYVIGVEGGVPERVTHHPANEILCDWTADDRLLFFASGYTGLDRMTELMTVSPKGGMPQSVGVPYGANGSISEDGTWLAYTPHSVDMRTWKRYRGGMATDIWLFNLKDKTSKKMTTWEGVDSQPMWHGKKVYYMSDEGPAHRMNIWVYDTANGKHEQVTHFTDYDIKWPAVGPGSNGEGEIVLQCGENLYLLNLQTNQSKVVNVTIPGDRPTIRTKAIDASDFIQGMGISSTGKRAVIQARGDVWTAPAEEGSPRNLTSTSGVAERDPAWSPDGRWIAYLSDKTGEYELYVIESDGKGDPRQVTHDGKMFRYSPQWSPDSKWIVMFDKSGTMTLVNVENGETKAIETDPWDLGPQAVSFSHDSQWVAYERSHDETPARAIWVYNLKTGENTQLTSGAQDDRNPTFDRKGDYLYYQSTREFNPTYGSLLNDTSWIYEDDAVILATPLRKDVKYPWPPKSDEETWEDTKKDDGKSAETKPAETQGADSAPAETKPEEDKKEEHASTAPVPDDGVSGTWEGSADTKNGPMSFTLRMKLGPNNTVTGTLTSPAHNGEVNGTYEPESKKLHLSMTVQNGVLIIEAKIDGSTMTGTGTVGEESAKFTATRSLDTNKEDKKEETKEEPAKDVKIEMEGLEARAFQLPIPAGQFGRMAVNDSNQLIYTRTSGGTAGIYLFDLKDDKKEEQSVAPGGNGFDISADGKKLLVMRGQGATIQNASAGATGKNVITSGMRVMIDPRAEWEEMFTDAWRMYRDYFYVPNMHNVDWNAIKEQYGKMVADCTTREDLAFVISEMISELNVGHAYYFGGDFESQPNVGVGLLGAETAIENGAYRITKIYHGAAWESEIRGPLSYPGCDVKVGDYILEINGSKLSTDNDPWAMLVGTVGQTVSLTVSDKPTKDDTARTVLVKPTGNDSELRMRDWIEANREFVTKQSNGDIGYVYVRSTGVDGQDDLVRQYNAQMGKKAIIIDERWNSGGQIPNRFIELLNRPVTNYWARRDGHDWMWPPDSNQGPKCMLINGLAGSGGDMFPWLFKHHKIGPLIGMRTWGGLVGISGNPGLIDGAGITVPTFGFYETDGTWG
ncbi:MAG TPA: PDZ domain-containing protein, partial [Phycisphaerales bacterium]|nr:PDZ domain-containing protein [Phycisphaerales bacterium]